MELLKPAALRRGDRVATISLSWGGAGDPEILWRYEQGKKRLIEEFGLEVVEMPLTLKGSDYVYEHPKERARDLMQAFLDPSIKGIFSCIGGNDSIRILPYIDFNVIRKYPKVFIGYSDSTVTHLICNKAGVTSFYGASVLMEFAENIQMHDYTKLWVEKNLFSSVPPGDVPAAAYWTGEYLPWLVENRDTARTLQANKGYEVLQGTGKHQGRLMGGCMEVLEMCKGTEIWPEEERWEDAILFFETSEEIPSPDDLCHFLRNYAAMGILKKAKALLFAKPYQEQYLDDYREVILKVVSHEEGLSQLPIFYNMNYGHTSPVCVMPYGVLAEIDCDQQTFTLLESGVK